MVKFKVTVKLVENNVKSHVGSVSVAKVTVEYNRCGRMEMAFKMAPNRKVDFESLSVTCA